LFGALAGGFILSTAIDKLATGLRSCWLADAS
jgi:hypothetical protein